jgi:hypothetical protein
MSSHIEKGIIPVEKRVPFHIRKYELIYALANSTQENRAQKLLELGEILAKSQKLSNTQKSKLLDALRDTGVLTYTNEFVEAEKDSWELDKASWDLENYGAAQISALVINWEFCSTNIGQSDRIIRLGPLLNAGHMLGTEEFGYGEPSSGANSLKNFEQKEKNVYARRLELAAIALKLDLITKDEEYFIEESSQEDFRNCPGYDILLVFDFNEEIATEKDPLTLYRKLQKVLYLGYGMSVRDMPITEKREMELYG